MKALQTCACSALMLLVTVWSGTTLVLASDQINIPDGTSHVGDLSARNGPIRLGDKVKVDGVISTRNGLIRIGNDSQSGDIESRNGAITLGRGNQVGEISTRNGSIELGDDNHALSLDTRNGSITVGGGSRVDGLVHTRNGSIRLAQLAEVLGSVSTRNGSIQLDPGSRIAGQVESRNGAIRLEQAEVGQEVTSRAGNIELYLGSHVGGDLIIEIEEQSGGWRLFGGSPDYPDAGHILILDDSLVAGDVIIRLPDDYNAEIPSITIAPEARVLGQVRVDSRTVLHIEGEVAGGIQQR